MRQMLPDLLGDARRADKLPLTSTVRGGESPHRRLHMHGSRSTPGFTEMIET